MAKRKKAETAELKWDELLVAAVNEPGSMLAAYSNFHNYSFGNCALAFFQAQLRGLEFGPFATYRKWQELGRQVERGERAITLCQPILVNKKDSAGNVCKDANGENEKRKIFTYKNSWFFLGQTSGDDVEFETGPEWDKDTALKALGITEEKFEHSNGNTQGYAKGKTLAINPVAQLPHKTLFHELGHIVLGHTGDERFVDGESLPRNLKEVEAEAVALIVLEALGLDGTEFARGYIQHWLGDDKHDARPIPEKSAAHIFTAASKILSAGTGKKARE
jgi:antirestriction protein ArdC